MADISKNAGPGKGAQALKLNIKLTKQQQQNLAAAVIIIAGIFFVYVKYFFMPNIKALNDKTAILAQKTRDLNDARDMVARYDEFLKNASDINYRTDFMDRRLPADADISDTIRELTQRATEYNISIIKFEPGAAAIKGDYKQTGIKLNFLTTYGNLGNFLTSMGYIERLTTPDSITIKAYKPAGADDAADNISVDMSVEIYSFI
jgi:Tfp pilus assembly protein PilO